MYYVYFLVYFGLIKYIFSSRELENWRLTDIFTNTFLDKEN